MASLETVSATGEISSHLEKLLKDISSELSPEELKHAVSLIKSNFKGKFEDQEEQDLYSCLSLFANQGLVSEDNLTLLEFLTPKISKKEKIHEKVQGFKTIRQRGTKTKEELTGRVDDLEKVMTKLTTGSSSVVNLYGSSGVGKTTLAIEILSKWPTSNSAARGASRWFVRFTNFFAK
jgi:ABC-type glutathione transport system ATPase component